MTMPKTNWKARCLEFEKENCKLRNELADIIVKLPTSPKMSPLPVTEKIVEKEVLPLWHVTYVIGITLICAIFCSRCAYIVKELQTPILSPYEVQITKKEIAPERIELDLCKDAWREDEQTIKALRLKLKQLSPNKHSVGIDKAPESKAWQAHLKIPCDETDRASACDNHK